MARFLFRRLLVLVSTLSLGVGGALAQTAAHARDVGQAASPAEAPSVPADDVIAAVGDQSIRFSQLTKELDQGAVPGVSVPGYGTPERKQILMRLLDDAIRKDLLYLDALRKGVDRDPAYQRELKRFTDGVLASLFRDHQANEARQVPMNLLREQWREGIAITINNDALDPGRDAGRSDDEVLATAGNTSIIWRGAKARLLVATRRAALSEGVTDAAAERRKVLDQLIDVPVMALRAREGGLEQDPAYLRQLAELRQSGLASFHYRHLAAELASTQEKITVDAQEHAETFEELDERARRAAERAFIEQKIEEYLGALETDGFHVMVDEAKLDRLFAREAERHAAKEDGAQE